MKKVNIRYSPSWLGIVLGLAAVVFMLIMTGAMASVCLEGGGRVPAVLSGVMIAVCIGIALLVDCSDTEVECCEDRLKCRLLWVRWEIDLTGLERVTYTVNRHASRYGSWNTLDLLFSYRRSDGFTDSSKLEVKISTDDLGECLSGRAENVPAMQIYNWVAGLYPEKAGGYVRHENNW